MYHHINLLILLACYGVIIYGIIVKETNTKFLAIVIGIVSIFVYPLIMEILINIKAKIWKSCETIESHSERHTKIYSKITPICYSEDYNITACYLEKCHPFDSCKYGRS
jgi:histone deacetylase 11